MSLLLEDFPEAPLPSLLDELVEQRDTLKRHINTALIAIDALRKIFPLNHQHELSNPEWIAARQGELSKEIEEITGQISAVSQMVTLMAGGLTRAESTATH